MLTNPMYLIRNVRTHKSAIISDGQFRSWAEDTNGTVYSIRSEAEQIATGIMNDFSPANKAAGDDLEVWRA